MTVRRLKGQSELDWDIERSTKLVAIVRTTQEAPAFRLASICETAGSSKFVKVDRSE
jgi:hypothetical protein